MASIQKIQIRAWVAEETYSLRLLYWAFAAIGLLALLLTLSGIYGVLAYLVSERTREIGIRMALGASARSVSALVLRQSMRVALAGAAWGAVAALALSKILASVLAMIDTFDRTAYGGAIALVLAACAATAWFPAHRAARIDPLTTLRHD